MGENVLELPDLSRMQMKAVILEVQAGRVKTGQKAEVRLDSNPDRVFKGVVTIPGRVFRVKSDSPAGHRVRRAHRPFRIRPGTDAAGHGGGVDITISSKENVLQVPEAAIVYREKAAGGLEERAFSEELTPVTVGARSSGMVEILSGLKEND